MTIIEQIGGHDLDGLDASSITQEVVTEQQAGLNISTKVLHQIALERKILRDVEHVDLRSEHRGEKVVVQQVVGSMAEILVIDAELSRQHYLGRTGLR